MPLSKPPPTISLHPPTTPFITPTAPLTSPLTSTPPELLLAIISFLPPTALYPLSLTSHHLHTFFHTHAASICNTFILTHHSYASSILQSRFTDGWLLPTHAAILNEESRILRDVVLGSGCKCGGCRVALSTSSTFDLSSPLLSEMEVEHGQDETGNSCLAGLRPQPCKAKTALDAYLRLSSPGPQYLVFLEKYSWEIVTRYSMGSFASSPPSTSTSTSSSQNTTATPSPTSSTSTAATTSDQETTEREQKEREKQEATFAFMIGNYCVRRFLDSASKLVSSIPSPSPSFSSSLSNKEKSSRLSIIDTSRRLGRKLRKRMRKVEKHVEIREREVEVEVEVEEVILDRDEIDIGREYTASLQGTTPRRMMFGEISPQSSHLGVDEKSLLGTQKKKRGERWEDGLLWYYGVPSLRAPSHEEGEREREVEGEVEDEIEEKGRKERGCIAVFKRGLGVIGRRVRGMFLGRCVGMRRVVGARGFRAL